MKRTNMSSSSEYVGIKKVVQISSGTLEACMVCADSLNATEDFSGAVNHYLDTHGYRLLHIGQQTSRVDEGLRSDTVAILGQP
jgi:tRNA U54 and U55 pseudouridine synthase Pus10